MQFGSITLFGDPHISCLIMHMYRLIVFYCLRIIDLINLLLSRNFMPTVGNVSCSPFVIVFADRKKLRKSCLLSWDSEFQLLAGDSRLKPCLLYDRVRF